MKGSNLNRMKLDGQGDAALYETESNWLIALWIFTALLMLTHWITDRPSGFLQFHSHETSQGIHCQLQNYKAGRKKKWCGICKCEKLILMEWSWKAKLESRNGYSFPCVWPLPPCHSFLSTGATIHCCRSFKTNNKDVQGEPGLAMWKRKVLRRR